jgi:glycosyltransferase involved in cell wall biosynthesis/peptidoglycan/xylan/chitin deacetylase (PgdA/CDA1 family)
MLAPIKKIITPLIPVRFVVSGCAPVLTYHACDRDPAPEIPAFDNVTPERLYDHISELKRAVRLVPIDELARSNSLRGIGAITFDDGYRSVIEQALPVFEALDVPFTIFVNTFAMSGETFWRHKVMYLINRGLETECERSFRKVRPISGQSFSEALKHPENNTKAVMEEIDSFLESKGLRPELAEHFLSRREELIAHRLIWYGNHSHQHHVMASLSDTEQLDEIQVTKRYLDGIPGIQLSRCFAIPFGRADQANGGTLAAVKESGYEVLLLNRGGVNRAHASAMGVRVLERFSASDAPIAWNLFREVAKTAAGGYSSSGLLAHRSWKPSVRSGVRGRDLRILQLVNSLDTGGAEKMVSSLSLELKRMGHSVEVLCLREFGQMPVPMERFTENGVGVRKFGKKDGLSVTCIWNLARFLKSERMDVIHSHNPLVTHYAAAAALLARTPLSVSTIHGTSTLEIQKWARVLFSGSCRLTDKIVLVCRQVQEEFCRRFRAFRNRTATIPNGIDVSELIGIPPRPSSDEFVFGTVGRLVPVKDHHNLLVAFAKLREGFPFCRLEVLGTGELQEELRTFAAALGLAQAVRFHGWSTDIPGFLSGIDTFVLSSRSEGLPMTLLEAMAAGVPVVSTAVGGVPEVVEPAGCGWLARPGDPVDLAAKMECAISARGDRGSRARSAVVKEYSVECMARRYAGLYEAALA